MTTCMLEKPVRTAASAAEHTRCGQRFSPSVDIIEKADELMVLADMPGVSGDSVDIQFENGQLSIHGRVAPRRSDDADYMHREYGVGDFFRTFQVSEAIDATRISANFADGVLTLHLPKVEAVKPRKISVKTG